MPDWKKFRAVVVIASVEVDGILVVVVEGVVEAVDQVVAAVEMDLAVLWTKRSSKWPCESSAEIRGELRERDGLLIHSASGGAGILRGEEGLD